MGGADAEAATGEPGTRATQGLAGALDPARRLVTETVVRAGGGIVWRRGQGCEVEIVLVHRPTDDDWSLPMGKLHPGETEAQAALRGVAVARGGCQERQPRGPEVGVGRRCWLGRRSGV